MRPVSDAVLLEVAGISATLLGFFVVGVFFFVQRGAFPQAPHEARSYLRAVTGTVLLLHGATLFLSIALVAFSLTWASVLYVMASLALVWSVARTSLVVRHLHRVLDVRVMWQTAMWAATGAVVGLPWILGGLKPSRVDLSAGVLAAVVLAFASSANLVLSAYDISRLEMRAAARRIHRGTGAGRDARGKEAPRANRKATRPPARWSG